mgnify:CR=1 FL=1
MQNAIPLTDYQFDPEKTNPVEADMVALQVVDKLDRGKNLLQIKAMGKSVPDANMDAVKFDDVQTTMEKLKGTLANYKSFKEARGEELLSYEPEVLARKKAAKEEDLANSAVKLNSADENTFKAMVVENGDSELFDKLSHVTPDGSKISARERYTNFKTMQMFGFSDREINSGYAEPMLRNTVGAAKDEPTINAVSRWGLQKQNEYDRSHKFMRDVNDSVNKNFLGMTGSQSDIEKNLNLHYSGLSNEERTAFRYIANEKTKALDKVFSTIKPLVRKTFNTIAAEEGIKTNFKDAGDEPFTDLNTAIYEIGKVPRKDFGKLVTMLAKTAEAHGQDVDSVMSKLGKNFTRAVTDLGGSMYSNVTIRAMDMEKKNIEDIMAGGSAWDKKYRPADKKYLLERFSPEGVSKGFITVDVGTGFAKDSTIEKEIKKRESRIGQGGDTYKNVTDIKDQNRAIEWTDRMKRSSEYASEIRNWREIVANVGSDNMFVNDWVYGTARSIPEMAIATTGLAGVFAVGMAQSERNMAEIRRADPNGNWDKYNGAAQAGGLLYGMLNLAQFKTLSAAMPVTKGVISSLVKRVFIESVQESGQGLSKAAALELYGAVDNDIKDLNFGEEVWNSVKKFPRTMFAVIPLVVGGMVGRRSLDSFSPKAYTPLLNDQRMQALYGMDENHRADIKGMPIAEALDYLQKHSAEFEQNRSEMVMPETKPNAGVLANPDGTFTISNGEDTVTAKTAEEAAQAAQQLDPTYQQRVNEEIDTRDIKDKPEPMYDPNKVSAFFGIDLPFLNDTRQESGTTKREGLPPVPMEGDDKVSLKAHMRYGLQSFLSQRQLPSRTLNTTLIEAQNKIKGVAKQFDDIAVSLDKKIKGTIKKTATPLRDNMAIELQDFSYRANRGDDTALAKLPVDIQGDIKIARESIDFYSKAAIDSGAFSGELADKIGKKNLGSYIFRQFKTFDKDSKWGFNYVKKNEPQIFAEGIREIQKVAAEKGEALTVKEAELVIKRMLDKTRGQDFYNGNSAIGGISVTSFIQRQDLSPAMLNLLGEVRNPAVNILETGKKVSSIAINYVAQMKMSEQMRVMGIASLSENAEKGHTYRIGEEVYSFQGFNENDEPVVMHGKRVAKKFAGFGSVWVDPNIGMEIDRHLSPIGNTKMTPIQLVTKALAGATAVGKYAQVILNPASYPANFLTGVATEIFNGRVSFDAKGARAYLNIETFRGADRDISLPYGSVEQSEFRLQKNSDVIANGGVNTIPLIALTTELRQGGLLDSNVLANDLKAASEIAFGESLKRVTGILSKLYQIPDNRVKHSAFIHELNKHMRAFPNETIGDAVKRALIDTRGTTQNYDLVPKVIKNLSSHGVILPTYISFRAELVRNTINTARLAFSELRSGNVELQKAGAKRIAGMLITAGALHISVTALSAWMSGLSNKDREKLDALKDPWLAGHNVIFLGAKDGHVRYFDPEYIVSQTMFYNALSEGAKEIKKGNVLNGVFTPLIYVGEGFTEMNILSQVAASVVKNKDKNGQDIYNAEVDGFQDRVEKTADFVIENMFTAGVVRTYNKIKKAEKEDIGFAGSTATFDDLALNIIGIRPYQKDTTHPKYLLDPLKQYAYRNSSISGQLSESKITKLEKEGDFKGIEERKKLVEIARQKLIKELLDDVDAFKVFDISDEKIYGAMKEAKIPKVLRAAVYKHLTEKEK